MQSQVLHTGDTLGVPTAPVSPPLPSFGCSTAAKSKQASDPRPCLKKDIASYLGSLSHQGVKYSLIKYSLAKTTAEVMIQAKLLLSTCLWVFVVFGWFLGVFLFLFQTLAAYKYNGCYVHKNYYKG